MKAKKVKKIAALVLLASLWGNCAYGVNYQVKSGDSLYKLAQKYSLSTTALKEANNLTKDTIYPGQYLYIPDNVQNVSQNHLVVQGDSLSKLAQKYNVTASRLKEANNLSGDTIYIGQVLIIPNREKNISSRAQYLTVSPSELDLMARIVYGESRGEPFEGQTAVASVILNRVFSDEFPQTIEGVVYQNLAFTAVADGQYKLTPDAQAYQAVRQALKGYDPTFGALYYWNPATATSRWVWSKEVTLKIGRHVFAR